MKKNQNRIETRQRRYSVNVSNPKAMKINTLLLLTIYQDRYRSAAVYVVVFDPFGASYILRRRICCHFCSLRAHLPSPTPPSSSYIPWAPRLAPAASVVVSDSSDVSCIPCLMPMYMLSLLSPLDRLNLPTPPPLSSIPSARKKTGACAVRDIHLYALYFMLPKLTPPLLSLRPWAARKNTSASSIGDVHSDTLYLMFPQLTPPL